MGDSYTPDVGQHVDQLGRVTYDFDAHVHARGIDLDAGSNATPPNDRRVRWLDPADETTVVAELYASIDPVTGDRVAYFQVPGIAGALRLLEDDVVLAANATTVLLSELVTTTTLPDQAVINHVPANGQISLLYDDVTGDLHLYIDGSRVGQVLLGP